MYDCTHVQTDGLKELCLELGAVGSRQTGMSLPLFPDTYYVPFPPATPPPLSFFFSLHQRGHLKLGGGYGKGIRRLRDPGLETRKEADGSTGGGWGGAVISLVKRSESERFLRYVKREYQSFKGLSREKVDEAAFVTLPGSGAGCECFASLLVFLIFFSEWWKGSEQMGCWADID